VPQNNSNVSSLIERTELIGSVIARRWAADVDGEGRFPVEAVDALCHQGALGSAVPANLGGAGANLPELCEFVRILARHCASTAMVLAIHHAMVFAIARHRSGERIDQLLREIADDQLLVTGCGCRPEPVGDHDSSVSSGVTILFGGEADLMLVRVGRNGAAGGDPDGLAVVRSGEIALRREVHGDGLGLRGLGWNTYSIEVPASSGDLLDGAYGAIEVETLTPALLLLAEAVWVGIADSALETAGRFVERQAARPNEVYASSDALRLACIEGCRDTIWDDVVRRARNLETGEVPTLGTASKDAAAARLSRPMSEGESGVGAVTSAMDICGPAGYRETGEFGLGRQLRDAIGVRKMVAAAIGATRDECVCL